jgi:hypothetical protein
VISFRNQFCFPLQDRPPFGEFENHC